MFEQVASSPRAQRRFSSLAFAAALHGLVLGGALFWSTRPHETLLIEDHLILRGPRGPSKPHALAPEGKKPTPDRKPKPRLHTKPNPEQVRPPPEDTQVTPPPETPSKLAEDDDTPSDEAPSDGKGIAGDGRGICSGAGCRDSDEPAGGGGDTVMSIGSGMSVPHPNAACGAPRAPWGAQQMGISGMVLAEYVVHSDGRADAVRALNGDAPPVYVEAVREWIEHCAFTPSSFRGQPISVRMRQVFRFSVR